jgi:tetratricopeptide (TPR) repeat protein
MPNMIVRRLVLMSLLALPMWQSVAQSGQSSAPPANPTAVAPDDQTAKDRSYALELYQHGKYLEALPWLEKLVMQMPNDSALREGLGTCLVAKADTASDPAERKALRLRARQEFQKASDLGDNSDYVKVALANVPENGRDPEFSKNPEVDRLMKQGEAAFASDNLDAAKNAYLAAMLLDPNNYDALLFTGDVYFRKGDSTAAGEGFSRAIQVDPSRETAYRYWGDALLKSGKVAAARQKYIDGALSSPYQQGAWSGISQYLKATHQTVTWYKIQPPASLSDSVNGKDVTINIDPQIVDKKDGSSAWISYPMERALWKSEKFAKEYPNEKQYRHSLKEESAALSLVASAASELSTGKKPEKLNDQLQALVKLKNAGLLDPYILLNVPDQGIAQDYADYYKNHRDVLVRYLNEVVLPPPPADTSQ